MSASMTVNETAVIDGAVMALETAALPLSDQGVVRGDGAFETMGIWSGRVFRREDHLDRLRNTLSAALLPAVDRRLLDDDIDAALERGVGGREIDAALRIYVTGSGARAVIVSEQPARVANSWLQPVVAPWIRPVGSYALAGAKTMSYMPNMVTSRVAQAAGADEALLLSLEGMVLEGPTFGVAWVLSGVLRAPSTDLGIVDSISRRTVLEMADDRGIPVETGRWGIDEVLEADEVMTSSAVRALRPVRRIGDRTLAEDTPITEALASDLERRRRGF